MCSLENSIDPRLYIPDFPCSSQFDSSLWGQRPWSVGNPNSHSSSNEDSRVFKCFRAVPLGLSAWI